MIRYITWSQVIQYLWDGWKVKPMKNWHGSQGRYIAWRDE